MKENINIYQLIINASLVVQIVIGVLVLASVASWLIIFQRYIVIQHAKKILKSFEEHFWSGMDLNIYFQEIRDYQGEDTGVENVFVDGYKEYLRLRQQNLHGEAVLQGVKRVMDVAILREQDALGSHLPFLASVGSISPYIGLFGTVWGIMSSFLALANATQAATINIVAPGIAEALIATAIGLFAAIPATLAFNSFSARSDRLLSQYEAVADEFSSILHRRVFAQQKTG